MVFIGTTEQRIKYVKLQKAPRIKKVEKAVALSAVAVGQVFRLAHVSFADALSGKDDNGFFMVINVQPKKTGRVHIVSLDGQQVLERDEDHQVIVHNATVDIEPAERG
jgi:predicted xylose isomerase-like sugar epimerase